MCIKLLSLTEKMLVIHDKKEVCGAILSELSKAFDWISYDVLLAKLNAYEFDQHASNVIHNYLFGRYQKTKGGSSFIDLLDIWCTRRFHIRSSPLQYKLI